MVRIESFLVTTLFVLPRKTHHCTLPNNLATLPSISARGDKLAQSRKGVLGLVWTIEQGWAQEQSAWHSLLIDCDGMLILRAGVRLHR